MKTNAEIISDAREKMFQESEARERAFMAHYGFDESLREEANAAFLEIVKAEQKRLGVNVGFPVSRKMFMLGYSVGRRTTKEIDNG